MANKKKEVYRPGPMTEGKRNIIQGLLQEYNIETAADIQEALKCCSRRILTRKKRFILSSATGVF